MPEPYWVEPRAIKFKISPHADLALNQGGNWDIERRYLLANALKHRSIVQRYAEGMRWEDTDLFTGPYMRRIAKEPIRGEATMEALIAQYYSRVDGLFEALRRDGFIAETPLPVLLIGRGQTFIGNQGNHRLAMAQVMGLDRFAGKVICRHPQA